jgi:signal transduction histidine kinase
VRGDSAAGNLTFTVWDTGIGIAVADLPRLFRPFEQLDSKLNRHYEGTGLGLSLVARLARLHGGSVSVESELGRGSRFTVTLPWSPRERLAHPDAGH